ncbi:digestive cysteine proteinase 3-like [Planococcus citri]|uniref:digestive cysteine proteinase 3-like n=1 Tax=Planococcus citri TaxID=170843 RepID=UPI0031F84314
MECGCVINYFRDHLFGILFNMRTFILLFVCSVIISVNFGTCVDEKEWDSFKKEYNKLYANTVIEVLRKNIFNINAEMIKKHNEKFNKGEVTFKMGMNEFGDLNHNEFLQRFSIKESHFNGTMRRAKNIADGFKVEDPSICQCNFSEVMSTVHNQKDCRIGWAYSMTDAIAGRYYMHKKRQKTCPPLSVQYLVGCSMSMGNYGCESGEAKNACDLIKLNRRMPEKSSYTNDNCSMSAMKNTVFLNITRCQIETLDENVSKLVTNLRKNGPMSASISAEHPSFQFAKEGIYYEDDCDKTPNHEVLLVGYNGTDQKNAYWIVKNSFGTSWGENGFLKISTKAAKNNCRAVSKVVYPVFSNFQT